jgi:hypothetical protein
MSRPLEKDAYTHSYGFYGKKFPGEGQVIRETLLRMVYQQAFAGDSQGRGCIFQALVRGHDVIHQQKDPSGVCP